jgi:hypothetical protein
MLYSKNIRFKRLYIAIFHNDIDCQEYRSLHTRLLHLSRSMMMKIEFVRITSIDDRTHSIIT